MDRVVLNPEDDGFGWFNSNSNQNQPTREQISEWDRQRQERARRLNIYTLFLAARRSLPQKVFCSKEAHPSILVHESDVKQWRQYVLLCDEEAEKSWEYYSQNKTNEELEEPHQCRCAVILKDSRLMYICSRFNYEFYRSQQLDTRENALAETNPQTDQWPDKIFEQHRCFEDLERILEATRLGDENLDPEEKEQLEGWLNGLLDWDGPEYIPFQRLQDGISVDSDGKLQINVHQGSSRADSQVLAQQAGIAGHFMATVVQSQRPDLTDFSRQSRPRSID